MYPWLVFGHLLGVALLVAGFSIYVANVDRLQGTRTLTELRVLLSVVTIGERILIVGGALLVPFAVIMAIQFWSLSDGWIATSIVLVLVQGAAGAVVNFNIRTLGTMVAVADPSDTSIPPKAARITRSLFIRAVDRAAIANLIEIVYLMTLKPAGFEILFSLVVTVLVAAILAASALQGRSSQASEP